MIDALYIAMSGLQGQQTQLDAISDNLANLQTAGFKRSRVSFADVAGVVPPDPADGNVLAQHGGSGSQVLSVLPVFTEGALRQTNNPLDLAIVGNGFLEVLDPTGARVYTRDGQLHVDAQGYLSTEAGYRLSGSVQAPPDARDLKIDTNGQVSAVLGGDTQPSVIGQIELAIFPASDGLQPAGNNTFKPTERSGEPTLGKAGENGVGALQVGAVEQSNVDMVQEMTTLVMAQRAFQLNARVLQAADEVLDTINNLRR